VWFFAQKNFSKPLGSLNPQIDTNREAPSGRREGFFFCLKLRTLIEKRVNTLPRVIKKGYTPLSPDEQGKFPTNVLCEHQGPFIL